MITEIGTRENSVLDVTVSAFANVKATMQPVDINLIAWLTSLKHKPTVDAIRAESDEARQKQMKKQLPLITVSGTFEPGRKDTGLINHSGLICIDIDKQDNPELENFDELGPMLKEIPHAAYVGRSVRGEGYMVIFVLENPELHRVYYRAIEKQFAEFGVVVDSCCINEARARFYSYCEEAQMRHQATPYCRLPTPIPPPAPKVKKVRSGSYTGSGKLIPEAVIDELQQRVSVADVVSYFSGSTTTKPGAGGSLKMQCPCPDTRDGSDRFTVWPSDNTFYCHKCHQGKGSGGVFKLLQDFNGMEFREAAHFLAETFCADLLPHFTGVKKTSAHTATALPAPAPIAQADEVTEYRIDSTHKPPPALMLDGWSIDTHGHLCDVDGLPYKQWYNDENYELLTGSELAFVYRWERVLAQAERFVDTATKYYGTLGEAIARTVTIDGGGAAAPKDSG